MDQRDRDAIDDLFDKIARVEAQSGPRDREAEAYIQSSPPSRPRLTSWRRRSWSRSRL